MNNSKPTIEKRVHTATNELLVLLNSIEGIEAETAREDTIPRHRICIGEPATGRCEYVWVKATQGPGFRMNYTGNIVFSIEIGRQRYTFRYTKNGWNGKLITERVQELFAHAKRREEYLVRRREQNEAKDKLRDQLVEMGVTPHRHSSDVRVADPQRIELTVTCSPGNVQEVVAALREMGVWK